MSSNDHKLSGAPVVIPPGHCPAVWDALVELAADQGRHHPIVQIIDRELYRDHPGGLGDRIANVFAELNFSVIRVPEPSNEAGHPVERGSIVLDWFGDGRILQSALGAIAPFIQYPVQWIMLGEDDLTDYWCYQLDPKDRRPFRILEVTLTVMPPCSMCDGTGYLLDQTYGFAEVPDGWTVVQRCDTCARFAGDDEAAAAAMYELDHSGYTWLANHGVAYFPPKHPSREEPDLPGDFAIRYTPPEETADVTEPSRTTDR